MAPQFPVTVDSIRQAIRQQVGVVPLRTEDLTTSVNKMLGTDFMWEELVDLCDEVEHVHSVSSGFVIDGLHALKQLTFTHRVTETEAAEGRLRVGVDLAFIRSAVGQFLDPFGYDDVDDADDVDVDDFPVLLHPRHALVWQVDVPDQSDDDFLDAECVVGPPDWLANKAGTLVGLRLRTDRSWEVTDDVTPTKSKPAALLTEAFAEATMSFVVSMKDSVSVGADIIYEFFETLDWSQFKKGIPELTLCPLTELFPEVGLTDNGERIAIAGTDWKQDRRRRLLRQLAIVWDVPFTSVEARALIDGGRLVSSALRTSEAEAKTDREMSDDDRAAFREALHVEHVPRLLATHPEDERLDDPLGELIHFLNDLRSGATRADESRIDWIISRLVDDPSRQADHLQRSLRADKTFVPALEDMLFTSAAARDLNAFRLTMQTWADIEVPLNVQHGRGDATVRQTLRMSMMQPSVAPVRVTAIAGRNDPCPCGSGKKFKQCHLGKVFEDIDNIEDQLIDTRTYNEMCAMITAWFDMNKPEVLNDANAMLRLRLDAQQLFGTSLFVLDSVAAWRTNADDFIALTASKGRKWSTSETAELRRMCARPISIYEVNDRAAGRSLTLRDLMSGDLLVVDAPDSSNGFQIGEYLLARVTGPANQLRFAQGAIGVPMRDRESTMVWLADNDGRPAAIQLCMWIIGRVGRFGLDSSPGGNGPIGHNTAGEALEFHRARMSTSMSATEVKDRLLASSDIGPDVAPIHGGFSWTIVENSTLVSTIQLWTEPQRDQTTAIDFECNSAERFQRIRTIMEGEIPGAVLSAHTVDSFSDVQLASELGLDVSNDGYDDDDDDDDDDDVDEPFDIGSLTQEDLDQLSFNFEQRWMEEQIPALGGLTPRQAADDPTRRADLIKLLLQMDGPIAGPVKIGYNAKRMADELGVELGSGPSKRPRLPGL
jgi:SEC-C motif